jgi:uncharacterized surface protein with fasciclin (FAS1) repeats
MAKKHLLRTAIVLALSIWVPFAASFQTSLHLLVSSDRFDQGRASFHTLRSGNNDVGEIQSFLESNYPDFYRIVAKNEGVWKALGDAESYSLFATNAQAFDALGDKKRSQLEDPRNLETVEKMGLFHCVSERVTADDLFNSGGVITLGGTVPVERSKSGGIFGVGGTDDGGVTVGGSRVTRSTDVGAGIVHETDGLVSPAILWRYVDQLRIPGSK